MTFQLRTDKNPPQVELASDVAKFRPYLVQATAAQRRRKQTRLVQSHFAVFLKRSLKAHTRSPVFDGRMVFRPKSRRRAFFSSSTQIFSRGGIVLRS